MTIIIIIISSNSGIIFSFYGFVKLLLMQSLHSCFPRAATDRQVRITNLGLHPVYFMLSGMGLAPLKTLLVLTRGAEPPPWHPWFGPK